MATTPPPPPPPPPPQPNESRKRSTNSKSEARKMRCVSSSGEKEIDAIEENLPSWKDMFTFLVDWKAYHNFAWPSYSCCWGSIIKEGASSNKQRLFFYELDDFTQRNTLVAATCKVVRPKVGEGTTSNYAGDVQYKKYKTIVHSGAVNRIRALPQNKSIVAAHTDDSTEVFIWDIDAQLKQSSALDSDSQPDLVLFGHTDFAQALAMSPAEPCVLSGGKDKSVVWWSIQDHVSTLGADATHSTGLAAKAAQNSTVHPRGTFLGHTDTVKDVCFCPSSSKRFCSVGEDSCLILWDARTSRSPILKVDKAHSATDLNCVDWNENYILTGSTDHSVCMFDIRNLTPDGPPLHQFKSHTASVLRVQWCPNKPSVFGSSGRDGLVIIWDTEKVGSIDQAPPPELLFTHAQNRDTVVDFQWNPYDPWTIVSVSGNEKCCGRGGTLQLWRMSN